MPSTDLYAAITGDFIRSRQANLGDIDRGVDVLAKAAFKLGQNHQWNPSFTRFRGDGWQVIFDQPKQAFSAALHLTATLRGSGTEISSRLAIGIGTIDTLGTQDLSDASGEAFFIAGDALDQMSPKRTLAIAGPGVTPTLEALLALTEFIASGWTRAQAEAVALAVIQPDATHDAIALQLGITRQAVQSRLASAGFAYLQKAIYAFQAHDFHS